VIVTDGGSGQGRSALAAVRALAAAGHLPVVTTGGRWSIAGASRYATTVAAPAATDPAYPEAIAALVARCRALTVLPASDAALLALGAPVGDLVDKGRLAEGAEAVGLPTPPSVVAARPADVAGAAEELGYPVVVKPIVSRRPAQRLETAADVHRLVDADGPFLVQPYLRGPMKAVAGVVHGGRLLGVVHQRYERTWPRDCGTASAAVTVARDEDVEERLVRLLGGYEGIFQAQFVADRLIDVNPRVYGSLPLAVAAGCNLVALWCDAVAGQPIPVATVVATPGVRYRWVEGDVRNVVAELRHDRRPGALRALAPRRGTAHSLESLGDPRPVVARARFAATAATARPDGARLPVVAFSGVDGAGKSSLVALVQEALADEGYPPAIIWTRPGMRLGPFERLAKAANRAQGRTAPGVREVAAGATDLPSRKGFVGFAWATLVTVLFLLDVHRRHRAGRGRLRVHDRHVADAIVTTDFVYRGADLRLSRLLIRTLIPRVDVTFYLDVPAEVAAARKPGDSFGIFAVERQLAAYDAALAGVRNLVRLDACRTQAELLADVMATIRPLLPAPSASS
jgi:thymidylate kinase